MLGISVIGWILLGVVYVPVTIALSAFALGRWRRRRRRLAVIAVLAYAPLFAAVVEAAYVDMRFKALCATAGAQIKQRVVVEGLYDDGFRGEHWETYLKARQDGYRFVEWKDEQGHVWRSERLGDGTVRKSRLDRPTARYRWFSPKFATPYGHLMKRREETIVDSETGEVIARHVMGYRYPAFIDRLWAQFMGGEPEICGSGDILSKTLISIDGKEK